MEREFYLGEEKWLEFKARPRREGDTLVITRAGYTLTDAQGAAQTGDCEIDGPVVRALISPPAAGVYVFELSVTIPPETVKERVVVRVT